MTDYSTLPDDVQRELVFDTLKATKACVALSNLTGSSPEVWMERISSEAYRDMKRMSRHDIKLMIGRIEGAKGGYGVQRVELDNKE